MKLIPSFKSHQKFFPLQNLLALITQNFPCASRVHENKLLEQIGLKRVDSR